MTIQELADRLTELCHHGKAQAEIRYVGEYKVHDIAVVVMVDDETAVIQPKREDNL